tara:strand:+ start:1756 stop:1920 length:165 start_codon:yes stop_codon:yes gene_type:complete
MEYNIWNLPDEMWALYEVFRSIDWNKPEEQTPEEKTLLNAIIAKQKKIIQLMDE